MIRTIAELLEAFSLKEVEILDRENIKHAPTIGDMYEGLTQEILRKSLPSGLELDVVSGFIEGEDGQLSRQIDCMLVLGEGERIPHTNKFRFRPDQVVAVIEVKKNLFSDDLSSAYRNLLSVRDISLKKINETEAARKQFRDAYYALIGEETLSYEDFSGISLWKKQIGLVLKVDSLMPIRMVIGYHGFSTEDSLRQAFITYLDKMIGHDGYGPGSIPNLITCGNYSLIKLNCMPYGIRIGDRQSFYDMYGLANIDQRDMPVDGNNMWVMVASFPENPLLLLLELLWTRIDYHYHLNISGNDLGLELIRPLILAKAIQRKDKIGWHYEYFPLSANQIASMPAFLKWKPFELDEAQRFIISSLMDAHNLGRESLDISDVKLSEVFNDQDRLAATVRSVVKLGVAALEGNDLKLLTRHLKIAHLPNGKIVAGEDNEGMFTLWLLSHGSD